MRFFPVPPDFGLDFSRATIESSSDGSVTRRAQGAADTRAIRLCAKLCPARSYNLVHATDARARELTARHDHVLSFDRVTVRHGAGTLLNGLTFSVGRGEFVALTGPSGAGKSTALRLAAALQTADAGRVTVNGQDIARLRRAALPVFRRALGVVPQNLLLLADRDVLANVMLPAHASGLDAADARERATTALRHVGLDASVYQRLPATLSGGEQQRVALARAVVNRPALLLVDEPTAHLDRVAAAELVALLAHFAGVGVAVLMAAHDESRDWPSQVRRIALRQAALPQGGSA